MRKRKRIENRICNTNDVAITGTIVTEPEYVYSCYGESFYRFYVDTERLSGAVDRIPVMASGRLFEITDDYAGKKVRVCGSYRSRRVMGAGSHKRCELYMHADSFVIASAGAEDADQITLSGYICTRPCFRITPLGREITDFILAVNRRFGHTDYIPCVAWGRTAHYLADAELGTYLHVTGRVQSREYEKKTDYATTIRTAYEVSIRFAADGGSEPEFYLCNRMAA